MNKKYYHISEHLGKRPRLSKNSLGEFCYLVLSCGAEIVQLWSLNHKYKGSNVYPVIKATEDQVKVLAVHDYIFVDPPIIKLN